MTDRVQTIACAVGLLVAFAGASGVARQVGPAMESGPSGLTAREQENVDQAASASLFGEFRSTMADFLWLKVDAYVHNGVAMRAVTPQEKQTGKFGQVTSADKEGEREHHGDETTQVPPANLDWRGVYGNIEREVQPYKDMRNHTHNDPKEALPLFRLMTLSNPHFIPGYVVGAAMIARDRSKLDQAIQFLLEGERNNPQSIQISEEIGEFYTGRYKRQYAAAMPYLTKAIQLGAARDRTTLTDDELEAYEDAYRWGVLDRRDAGDQKTARAMAIEGLRLFPGDIVCRHYLEEHPEPKGS